MDPPVRPLPLAVGMVVLLASVASLLLAPSAAAGSSPASSTSAVTGTVTGPSALATSTNGTFYLNASGGPAYVNGTFEGSITWNATLVAANLTGASVSPSNGTITPGLPVPVKMLVKVGTAAESLTLSIRLTSILGKANASKTLSVRCQVVVPYIVRATLVAGSNAVVLPFNVSIALDGTPVGTVQVPKLQPNATYALAYRCPAVGLSSGYHTFTLSVAELHGLVTFSNGRTVETTTFYVAPASPNDTLWYVTGVVAFFGVLLIYATRVAARRRGAARR